MSLKMSTIDSPKQNNAIESDVTAIVKDYHFRGLMKQLESKDKKTYDHSYRVGLYAMGLGTKLGLSSNQCASLFYGGWLHDIGKLKTPDYILQKPTSLTNDEYNIIKQHPQDGYDILKRSGLLEQVEGLDEMVLHHHERLSGIGYPHGLAGDEVSMYARIIGIADSFDAMTAERVYRKGLSVQEAVDELVEGKHRLYDEYMVDLFISMVKGINPQ